MKLIKKHMTLEEYETKYPKYQTKLLSFSDAEIKEFNSKFAKNNGNKQILDKYALLNKYKWVHIKDRYYQIPRVSKLGKAGIALGGAAAIACAVVLPLTLSGVTLSEEEFKSSLSYICDITEDRKFIAEGDVSSEVGIDNEKVDTHFKFEVDGRNGKYEYDIPEANGSTELYYERYNEDNYIYYSNDDLKNNWVRLTAYEKPEYYEVFFVYEELASHFTQFKKSGKNSYSVSNYTFSLDEGHGLTIDFDASYEFTFNKDKTLNEAKGELVGFVNVLGQKIKYIETSSDMKFSEINTHKINNPKIFTPPTLECFYLTSQESSGKYESPAGNVTNGATQSITIFIGSSLQFNSIYMYCDAEERRIAFPSVEDISVVYKPQSGSSQKLDFEIIEGDVLKLKNPPTFVDADVVEITYLANGYHDNVHFTAGMNLTENDNLNYPVSTTESVQAFVA